MGLFDKFREMMRRPDPERERKMLDRISAANAAKQAAMETMRKVEERRKSLDGDARRADHVLRRD